MGHGIRFARERTRRRRTQSMGSVREGDVGQREWEESALR